MRRRTELVQRGLVVVEGEYADNAEADAVSRIILLRFGERLANAQARDLAVELPVERQPPLMQAAAAPVMSSGIHAFLRRARG